MAAAIMSFSGKIRLTLLDSKYGANKTYFKGEYTTLYDRFMKLGGKIQSA